MRTRTGQNGDLGTFKIGGRVRFRLNRHQDFLDQAARNADDFHVDASGATD